MPEQPADGSPPLILVKTLNYQELRMMVEAAASYRDQEVYLVVDEKGWSIQPQRPDPPGGKAVIPCKSPGRPTARPSVGYARIGIDPTDPDKAANLLELEPGNPNSRADAVFWTPAAVEKFLVPYYASVYGDQAPKKLTALIDILGAVRDPSANAGEAFAVAHMPKSEYVQLDGGLGALVRKPDGGVQVTTISDYLEGRP
jgi:hypothetical protein